MVEMKDTPESKRRGRAGPEPRIVEITYAPTVDAQDRLRRLFTLLVRRATQDKAPVGEGSRPADRIEAAD